MARPIETVITSKGIQKVVSYEMLNTEWYSENSKGHHRYRVRLESGATVIAYPLDKSDTSKYVTEAYKGISYDGKKQTVNGKYTIEINLDEVEFSRDIQQTFLTGQLAWEKIQNKAIAHNASLQALKKYINLTPATCVITNPKYPNSEYVCTRDTYDRDTLHMYVH